MSLQAKCLFFIVHLLCISGQIFGAKYDGIFDKCKSSDDKCLSSAIETGIKKMAPGIPSMNIPPLDPVEVKEMHIGAGTSAVHLEQHYANLKIFGFGKPTVNQTKFDSGNNKLTFITLYDQLEQKANYEVNGKILIAPVSGKGDSSIIIEKVAISHEITFKESEKNGEKYLTIQKYEAHLGVGHAKYKFDNLFNGNKELGDNINRLINDEWEAIYLDIKEGYEVAYSAIFKQFADKVFSKIPLKAIFS